MVVTHSKPGSALFFKVRRYFGARSLFPSPACQHQVKREPFSSDSKGASCEGLIGGDAVENSIADSTVFSCIASAFRRKMTAASNRSCSSREAGEFRPTHVPV